MVLGVGAAGKALAFDLNTFTFNGHTLRTVMLKGEPWFVLQDIYRCLGLGQSQASNAARITDPSERIVISSGDCETVDQFELLFTKGRTGRVPAITLLTESGLYKCTLRAQRKNPAAREFQDWVTKEVLPRIRKDGGYIMGEEKVATGEITAEQAESPPTTLNEEQP